MAHQFLTVAQIIGLHDFVLERTGGLPGFKQRGHLKLIAEKPRLVLFEKPQYPTVFDQAAVYFREIAISHAFNDGNKRTGFVSAGVFLLINGYELDLGYNKTAENFAVRVVEEKLSIEEVSSWLQRHSRRKAKS